jgi:lipoprotein-releasing system ATP-binding protein
VKPALAAHGIHRAYTMAHETIPVLDGLDLELARGESVSVLGASGSGKTTMINVLGMLDRPDAGELEIDGEDVLEASGARRATLRNRHLGFVFQFYHLVNELTALENVMLPARIGGGWLPSSGERSAWKDRARDLLLRVGLSGRERHRPNQLPAGGALLRRADGEPRPADEPRRAGPPPRDRGRVARDAARHARRVPREKMRAGAASKGR